MERKKMYYFGITYNLYKQYQKINQQNPVKGFQVGYTIDGLEILQQLDFLYEKITIANNYFADQNEELTKKIETWRLYCIENNIDYLTYRLGKRDELSKIHNHNESMEILFEAKLYTEMFYYKAFRLRNIIRYSGGLGKKFECKGVRNIRNILLEHPEKSGLIYTYSFGLGIKDIGPLLRNGITENDKKFKDIGLFKNAIEFKINLETILTNFIKLSNNH